jgi:membrane carboxypeptidase/penicillin-binding protein PbpC
MNRVYYGSQAYGAEAAAQTYFSKHAKDLTLSQAALLAGLPQAPSQYDPVRDPRTARAPSQRGPPRHVYDRRDHAHQLPRGACGIATST